ncbi:MAG: cation diffusion facilitator family transporter [Candidatus Hermodarchaeota archaeon]
MPENKSKILEFLKMDEKTYAASSSVIAAIFLTVIKFVVGIWSGSLGILSEALHSALDLLAAGVTLLAVRSSSKPADLDHQFGHGKIESLSALVETLLLLITIIWIMYEAVRRIVLNELEIITHPITFGVVILAIIIDYSRSRLLYRMAKKYDSQALKADALHFSTDILSSSVVFVGLIFAMIGYPIGDPLAAIGVAIIVLVMTINLGKETVDSLLDRAPLGEKEKVRLVTEHVEGVISCEKIRLRKSGIITFVDLTIVVDPNLSLEKAHSIAENVTIAIQEVIKHADVSVHMDPTSEDLAPVIKAIRKEGKRAEWIFNIHNISTVEYKGKLSTALHIEVEGQKSLGEIHDKLDNYKKRLHEIDSRIDDNLLTIHIEPFKDVESIKVNLEGLEDRIRLLTEKNEILYNPHGIKLSTIPSGIFIILHCNADPNLSIEEIHKATKDLEEAIAREVKGKTHIYIYVEPQLDK